MQFHTLKDNYGMSRLLPKHKVEEAKKAKQQAKADKKRKVETRVPHVSFLIVCEGTKTEPNYFEALIQDRNSEVVEYEIAGEGRGTVSLVKQAIALRKKSHKQFDRVWAVFDKDDFTDFNEAITLAKKNKIQSAWSNEAFELWYYLHFQYLDTGVSRSQYITMIEREIRKRTKNLAYKYNKKSPDTYRLLKENGNEVQAIENARRLKINCKGTNYASHKPCTTIYELVEELNHPEKLL